MTQFEDSKVVNLLDLVYSLFTYACKRDMRNKVAELGLHHTKFQPSADDMEWLQESAGYYWLNEEFRKGTSRAEIILEFNRKRRTDPTNFVTPDNRPMTISLFKSCVASYEYDFPEDIDFIDTVGNDSPANWDFDDITDSNFELLDNV